MYPLNVPLMPELIRVVRKSLRDDRRRVCVCERDYLLCNSPGAGLLIRAMSRENESITTL